MRHLCSIIFILSAVTAFAAEQSRSITIRGWQFEIPTFLIQKATTGPDFTVTYLSSNERKITVGIYEGMHPQQFADKKSGVTHEKATINGQAASWTMWEEGDTNKEYHAELLFNIDPSVKSGDLFHIFVTASTRGDLSMIREMVSRARKAKKPNRPAAGNAGFTPQLAFGSHWPVVPEPQR